MQKETPAYKRIVLKLSGEAMQERGGRDNVSLAVVREIAERIREVRDRDPNTDAGARRFDQLTFSEALAKRLQIMDSTAFSLCMDNKIPIVVFDMNKPSNIRDAVLGRKVGTVVCDELPSDVKIQTP